MFRAGLAALSILAATVTAFAQQQASGAAQSVQALVSGWQTLCRSAQKDGKLNCTVFLEVVNAADKSRVVSVEVGRDGKGHTMLVSTPLGVDLKSGVEIQIDAKAQAKPVFSSCMPQGCIAGLPLSDALLSAMQSGSALAVRFTGQNGNSLKADIPLSGFAVAFKKMAN